MKERKVRCKECGERFTVVRFARERTPSYCDLCREERRRAQTRAHAGAPRAPADVVRPQRRRGARGPPKDGGQMAVAFGASRGRWARA